MTRSADRGYDGTEIAVIGLSGRFPDAATPGAFWENLASGRESVTFFTDADLQAAGVEESRLRDPSYVKAGVVLDDVDLFDAAFFGVTPREAELMDPQRRLFLECAWEALESAACDPGRFKGDVGLFAGTGRSDYLPPEVMSDRKLIDAAEVVEASLGSSEGSTATRVSYLLDLRGPSLTVNTACSTSLVAIHLACQSLLTHECDVALAGGVSVRRPAVRGYRFQEGMIVSPDGHCRPFDSRAGGTVLGQGLGIIVLRRLGEALENGDPIRAIIRGSAVNNDGRDKISFAAPSASGQAEVIAQALSASGVDPETVTFIETHGTGTRLGDPIEIAALTQAYGSGAGKQNCAIGAVKSNFGHLEVAAGVTGFIKTVLALEHGQIPPSLNFETPNPEIDFESSPFFVNARLREWGRDRGPRRAGVSSFGIGGTNAHVILEEAPAPVERPVCTAPQLLVLSARSESALDMATDRLAAHLEDTGELGLDDVAWTLQTGRRAFRHRRALAAEDVPGSVARLRSRDPRHVRDGRVGPEDPSCAFLFTGQGAQYPGMAREIYATDATFRKALDRCIEQLEPQLGAVVRDLTVGGGAGSEADPKQTRLAQPALFAVEYALARMWEALGIRPDAMIGHSVGEYVAATIAGIFSLEDALAVVSERARLMQDLPPGSMLVVHLGAEEVEPFLADGLSLAARNAPDLCVVSGAAEDVTAFARELSVRDVETQALNTSHAFHSSMMEPAVEPFRSFVARFRLAPPRIPFVSNVTGDWITSQEATDPTYWARHLREPVRFGEGLAKLLRDPARILVEVGPGRTLATLARQHPSCTPERPVVCSIPSLREKQGGVAFLLDAIGQLWVAGRSVNWSALPAARERRLLLLPTYPFERQSYWIEPGGPAAEARPERRAAPQAAATGRDGAESGERGPDAARHGEQPVSGRADVGDWFRIPSWRRVAKVGEPDRRPAACRLVFRGPSPLHERLARALADQDSHQVVVEPGSAFARKNDGGYTVRPGSLDDYVALLRDLRAARCVPDAVTHLWCAATTAGATADDEVERGFYSLTFLARAVGETGSATPLEIDVVTAGVYQVTGDEPLCPERATVIGPCRVIPQELESVECRHLDLDPSDVDRYSDDAVVERVIEQLRRPSRPAVLALRHGQAWQQEYAPVHIADPLSTGPLRDGGVYLITGGLGGVGLQLARHLALNHRPKLALLSRNGLPSRQAWPEVLEGDTATARRIRAVQDLEQLGAEVVVVAADVSDEGRMREVVESLVERFGGLDGAIHAAGIAGGGLIQLKERDAAAAVLAPKVAGTRSIARALEGLELDFLVLASSRASVNGGVGQIDYAAANAYLDAFAYHHTRTTRVRTVAINWNAWREVGMAVETAVPEALREKRRRQLESGVTNAQGVETFRRILAGTGETQVAIYPGGGESTQEAGRRPAAGSDASVAAARDGGPAAAGERRPRPELSQPYAPPSNELEAQLAEIWAEVFGFDRLGINDDFFELGGHSLLATRLASRLREYEIGLALTDVFDAPTIVAQAELLLARLLEEEGEVVEAATTPEPVEARSRTRTDG